MNTEILCILDRSGSMARLVNDTIGGFNAFIESQRAVPGNARVTIIQFDGDVEYTARGVDVQTIAPLDRTTYVPSGSTALLDAVGHMLNDQGKRIHDEKWADKVIVCVITDGGENTSTAYTRQRVREMVGHAEKHGWSFIYLGANVNAFSEASSLGINTTNTNNVAAEYAHSGIGTRDTYAFAGATMSSLRGGGSARVDASAFKNVNVVGDTAETNKGAA